MINPPILQPCLIVLVGPPGSGKSRWAASNNKGAVVVSQDEFIDAITPHGFDHAFRPVYSAAENATAKAALAASYTVIVDRTNRTRVLRERWIRVAHEARCPVVAVVMSACAELCRVRNRARNGPRRVTEERMERMLASMEAVSVNEGFAAVFGDEKTGVADVLEYLKQRAGEERYEYCNQAG